MDVPSQATKVTAVAILIAVLLSVLFTALNTNKKLIMAGINKSEEMNITKYGGDYETYVNTNIDGYKLRALLKEAVNRDIKIIVRFKNDSLTTVRCTATFDYRTNTFTTTAGDSADKNRKNFFLVDTSSLMGINQMITDYSKSGWYVDPFANFKCTASVTGQVIEALYFDQV